MFQAIIKFIKMESAASIVLLAMTVVAMVLANSPLYPYYELLHRHEVELVINEGLMAVFFLCIGIEIKLEMKEGSLATRSQVMLPMIAAFGGVLLPAGIYAGINWGHAEAMRGWAVPTATDIAFSLGVLAVFGKRVPAGLRIFLLSIAVFDDLIAVAVIAVFYTKDIQWFSLAFAVGCVALLYIYNRHVKTLKPFLFAGAALWVALLDAGVSPTVAGVALGLLMPLGVGKKVMHYLHAPVAFLVVPVFVLANAGVRLVGLDVAASLHHPASMGIILALFVGKQVGIFTASAFTIRCGWAKLPEGSGWWELYAVSAICGIGFTMSLFIGALAFGSSELMMYTKIGVLTGSLASAVAGIICMAIALRGKRITL